MLGRTATHGGEGKRDARKMEVQLHTGEQARGREERSEERERLRTVDGERGSRGDDKEERQNMEEAEGSLEGAQSHQDSRKCSHMGGDHRGLRQAEADRR